MAMAIPTMAKRVGRHTRSNVQLEYEPHGNSLGKKYGMPKIQLDMGEETGFRNGVHVFWESRKAGAVGLEKCGETEWNLQVVAFKITSRNPQGIRYTRASGKRIWRFTLANEDMAATFMMRWTEERDPNRSESEATQNLSSEDAQSSAGSMTGSSGRDASENGESSTGSSIAFESESTNSTEYEADDDDTEGDTDRG